MHMRGHVVRCEQSPQHYQLAGSYLGTWMSDAVKLVLSFSRIVTRCG